MVKFDPLLDFYDPTLSQESINNRLQAAIQAADKVLASFEYGLIETGVSPFSRFGRSFELTLPLGNLLPLLDELYSEDFLKIDCSPTLLSSADLFDLYLFLLLADKAGIFWYFRTPISNNFLRDVYAQDYRVVESYSSNPYGVNHRFIDVYNYSE